MTSQVDLSHTLTHYTRHVIIHYRIALYTLLDNRPRCDIDYIARHFIVLTDIYYIQPGDYYVPEVSRDQC